VVFNVYLDRSHLLAWEHGQKDRDKRSVFHDEKPQREKIRVHTGSQPIIEESGIAPQPLDRSGGGRSCTPRLVELKEFREIVRNEPHTRILALWTVNALKISASEQIGTKEWNQYLVSSDSVVGWRPVPQKETASSSRGGDGSCAGSTKANSLSRYSFAVSWCCGGSC